MKNIKSIIAFNCFTCLIVGIFLLFIASQSMAANFCVANKDDLIAALNDAQNNGSDDLIKIQQGTYYGNFIYASTESFGVTIKAGYSDALCTLRDVDPANTVLDAEGDGAVLVLSAPDVAANFAVDGLTLQNGNVNIQGGGLFAMTNGTVILTNNTINNNNANQGGGVSLRSSSGTVTLTGNSINYNSANSDAGGVFLQSSSGSVTLTNNTIKNNSAQICGGGAFLDTDTGSVTLTNNTIKNNNNANFGGGAFLETDTGTATLTNNTISDNSADYSGGGVYFYSSSGTATLTNNTISDNSAEESGGGVWLKLRYDSAIANIYNNIIWNNDAGNEGGDLYIENDGNNNYFFSTVNLFNNDFDHSENDFFITEPDFPIHSSNLNNVDPSFVDPGNGDYHLREDSLLINAGNDGAHELPLTDKDGNPRKVGSAVDIGAYEYQEFVSPVAAFTASPLVGVAPLTVEFFGKSTGSIDTRYWDFGDGNNSTLQNPTHTYNIAGTYTVSLTATGDSVSDTETKNDYITVVSPDAPDLSCKVKEFHCVEFGQKIVVKLQVENSGNTKADPFDVAFYLSNNGTTQDELLLLDTVNGGLNSQHTKVISLRYEFESSLSGIHIIAVIDPDGRVLELDETNNSAATRVP
jgi:parallel beta-helix repeat protein